MTLGSYPTTGLIDLVFCSCWGYPFFSIADRNATEASGTRRKSVYMKNSCYMLIEKYMNWIAVIVGLVPLGFLVFFVSQHYINVPFSDQWGLVPLIEKSLRGDLSFEDLWVQKNVHRILFPKIIMLSLAVKTHWDIAYEVAVSIILSCGIYVMILWQTFRTFSQQKLKQPIDAPILLSLFIFSLSQYENWLWGMQIQIFLNLFVVVAGLFILNNRLGYSHVIVAIILGFIATHSFANGLVYWVVGLIAVLFLPAKPKVRWIYIILWIVFGAITIFSFFYGYILKGQGVSGLLSNPASCLLYVFVALGAPVVAFHVNGAAIAGVSGICLFVLVVLYLLRKCHTPMEQLIPYICFALYAIGSAVLTSIGRGDLGIQQAASSRYITTSNLLWIANIVLLSLAFHRQSDGKNNLRTGKNYTVQAFFVFLLPFIILSYFTGMKSGVGLGNATRVARVSILVTYPETNLAVIRMLNYNRPIYARQMLDTLKHYHLSLFRE